MRKSVVYSVLFILVGFLASVSSVHADTEDGATPAAESVCDVLAADGVTKGLYGLCVAYCEAEASSLVLENYDRKRREGDPAMPCLDDPPVTCPCWSAETLVNAFDGSTPFFCVLDSAGLDAAYYDVLAGRLTAGINADSSRVCQLIDPPELDITIGGLTTNEVMACRLDVLDVIAADFTSLPCINLN